MNEFEDQFMGDCGVEGRAEVHKEHPYICVGVLQGGQGCVRCAMETASSVDLFT